MAGCVLASWIFSTNDVIANLGVIVGGALVYYFTSRFPDLVIGFIVGIIVTARRHAECERSTRGQGGGQGVHRSKGRGLANGAVSP